VLLLPSSSADDAHVTEQQASAAPGPLAVPLQLDVFHPAAVQLPALEIAAAEGARSASRVTLLDL
jgi:hypothetical protein